MLERKVRRDAEENRRTILETANRLFEKYGIEEVSMHQIAKAAGVGQGTLYRRYADKGDLCRDLKQEKFRRFLDGLHQGLAELEAHSAREKIGFVLERTVDFIDEQAIWLQFLQLQRPVEAGVRKCIYQTELYGELNEALAKVLATEPQLMAKAGLPPAALADSMLAMLTPNMYFFLRHDRGLSKEAILNHILTLYLGGGQ